MIPRNPKILEGAMKTIILTPDSSTKSNTTMDSNSSETRDNFYFPGCRKDANCSCEICIASINATLDLMSQSVHRSSLTKLSASVPKISRSPVPFGPSSVDTSTPKSRVQSENVSISPPLNSTARMSYREKVRKRNRKLGFGAVLVRCVLGLMLGLVVEYGVSWVVSGVMKARFSSDVVKYLGDKSRDFEGLNARFLFLKNELEGFVGKKVSSCSSNDSLWKISQEGLLLNSRCVLYESMTEEIRIWGWPLQAAGLLTAESSSRSFSIISGRVMQWSNGESKYFVRKANSSWVQVKWSASVVQFDPNTWILEYRQSFLMDNPRLVTAALEFLKFRIIREFEKMKQEFWLLSAFGGKLSVITHRRIIVPT